MPRIPSHRLGAVLAGGGMLLISLDSLGIRLARSDRWDVAFWLGAFTAISISIVLPLRTGKSIVRVARETGRVMLAASSLQAGSLIFFVMAVSLTTVANTVVIIAAAPVIAALISRWTIREHTGLRTWVAIGASIAGILLVVSGSQGVGRIEGDLFAVAAIISFAANITLLRHHPDLNRLAIVGVAGALMAIVTFIPADPLAIDIGALLILLLLGAVVGPAGRFAVANSTRYLPASQVSLFAPVETVAAIGWAWLFLGEAPPATTIVGGVIVVAAVVYGSAWQPEPTSAALKT